MRFLLTLALIGLLLPAAHSNPIDLYGEASIEAGPEGSPTSYRLYVRAYEEGNTFMYFRQAAQNPSGPSLPNFDISINQERLVELKPILEKFLKWEQIAREKDVMPFEKEIGRLQNGSPVLFRYGQGDPRAKLIVPGTSDIYPHGARLILKGLPLLPKAQADLETKSARAKKEEALFN